MSSIVGTALVVLVIVGMPLRYGAGQPIVVEVLGPVHGLLYLVYLVSVIDLARHVPLTVLSLAAMAGAGLVPFLTFVVERRIVRRVSGLPAPTGHRG